MATRTGEKKITITIDETQVFEVSTHETVLSSLTEAGMILEASCGGQGSCGKCRIRLLSGQVLDRMGNHVEPMDDGRYLACKI